MTNKIITMSHGSGGAEMNVLIKQIREQLGDIGIWTHGDDDAAIHQQTKGNIVFTSDSYVITPLFFPGGNIGDIAFCGTVNDLSVMGAKPLGISLALIIEEGFAITELMSIISSIGKWSKKTGIPIVTGDTKVMEKGSVDKIVINTSGVGEVNVPLTKQLEEEDIIIASGGIGEHACTLLAQRYEMETALESDVQSLFESIDAVRSKIKLAKDLTRGGLAAALNEIAEKQGFELVIDDEKIPLRKEVRSLTNLLGIEATTLACEGRFVCVSKLDDAPEVLKTLQKYHKDASIIGTVKKGTRRVVLQTKFGRKILPTPSGVIVPRIC